MESPVRICLGAALVVNILLLSSTSVNGNALPLEPTLTTVIDERAPRSGKINGTWTARNKPKSPDISINELKPKDSTSEEHTEKNAKYKDRGRVRYFTQSKTTTESPLRRIRSTEASKLVVVTPTPAVKTPADIIDSMHTYKRTKLPIISTTTPVTVDKEDNSEEEAYEDEDDDDKESFEKFSSNRFDNFFTIPSYNYGDAFNHDADNESSDNKVNKNDYSSPTYGGFSSLFPGEPSYGYKDTTHDIFKSESFFSFDSDLTTPKNDKFDEKFQKITTSIIKNLDTIKVKTPPANTTNVHKIVQENVDMEKVGNNTPSNKSSVFIKNTKEVRLLDNDGASSAAKELSDVHGTSIYYEMSVLSTETYAIHSEDDCDNESLSAEPTVGTSSEEELASLKETKEKSQETALPTLTTSYFDTAKPTISDSIADIIKSTSKSKPASRTKSRYNRIKSTSSDLEPDTYKPNLSTERFERVRTTSSNEKFGSVRTTSASMRRGSAKSSYSTLKAASTKSSLSKLGSESVKPTLSDSSAESAKTTLSGLRFETAKPTSEFIFESGLTIPSLTFETTLNPTFPSPTFEVIRPTYPDPSPDNIPILSTDILPVSTLLPIFNSINSVPVSTQNIISTTERSVNTYSSSYPRNRSYSKRLNLNGNKDSPNSVTSKPEVSSTTNPRSFTRKFHHSTPRNKPTWMAPKRNVTRTYVKPTYPTTIYSEHFSIKDKYKKLTTVRPKPYKTVLTTISSDIDPVLENDGGGTKKIVHSQSVADNTVPGLWKRGSTKVGTSTSSSTEVETEEEWQQILPTSTAWALASLRSPPPTPHAALNGTKPPKKSVDENELQKVGEVIDKKETTITPSVPTIVSSISNDIIPKVTEVVQNKLTWQPILAPKTPSSETQTETQNEIKSETVPAESNISIQSSVDPATTETTEQENQTGPWIPVTFETTDKNEPNIKTIPPVDSTKSTGFESITKLPAGVTTPQDETAAGSEDNQTVANENSQTTTDYTITTIRFSYVPTEEVETQTQPVEITPTTWHPVFPTRTRLTSVKNTPITTYRPTYMTTTETVDESTTIIPETTSRIEVSSQVLENASKLLPVTTEINKPTTTLLPTTMETTEPITTEATTNPSTTIEVSTQPTTVRMNTEPTTMIFTTQQITTQAPMTPPTTTEVEDTTTIVVEVVTEINTEREQIITSTVQPETTETSSSELPEDCTEESSGSNEIITENTPETTTTTEPATVKVTSPPATTPEPTTPRPTTYRTTTEIIEETTKIEVPIIPKLPPTTTEFITEVPETTQPKAKIMDTTMVDTTTDSNFVTKSVNSLEDVTGYADEATTEASSITLNNVYNEDDTGSGAAIAIAVSTIGVIALILLIGLLLVVRRRGRRGVYAQRCTPVSLDAYSLDSVSVGHRKGNQRLRASKRSYGNPAYDDEVTSHPMQYAALANFALDMDSMTAEFAEIPSVSVRPEEVPPGCEDKNRYSNVLPLPETRVPLRRIGNDPTTEYINANYVTGPGNIRNYYIAAQAPLSNTVVDFWRMIWEQNSRLIVMLTEYMENGVEKCYEYLPPSEITDNKRTFGEFKIILKKREQRDKYAISSVQLINLSTRTWREITHLWYFWPAKGVPDDYDSVIDFLCEMRSYMKISQTAKEYDEEGVEVIYGDQSRSSFSNLSKLREDGVTGHGVNVYSPARAEEQMKRAVSNNGTLGRMKAASEVEGIRPCVVTCASGAGRSAALVALDVCARALPTGAGADVPRAVRQLRAQRPHSLSNRHHYIFVYKVLSEYGNKMLGGGVDTI